MLSKHLEYKDRESALEHQRQILEQLGDLKPLEEQKSRIERRFAIWTPVLTASVTSGHALWTGSRIVEAGFFGLLFAAAAIIIGMLLANVFLWLLPSQWRLFHQKRQLGKELDQANRFLGF